MTRKDYIEFARVLKDAKTSDANAYREGEDMRQEIGEKLIDVFQRDNQRFDGGKFREAAELN